MASCVIANFLFGVKLEKLCMISNEVEYHQAELVKQRGVMIVCVHGGFLLRRGQWHGGAVAGWLWEEITLPLVARLARAQRGAFEGERGCLL